MRGKAVRLPVVVSLPGITPAYAGKRVDSKRFQTAGEDHPRVCGEKHQISEHFKVAEGSPPRMRGKDAVRCVYAPLIGITPAYAGKSLKENNDAES